MPEVLKDGGVFFDPERPDAIASAVERIVTDPAMRERIAKRAFDLSCAYSWKRCAEDTFSFLAQTARLNVT